MGTGRAVVNKSNQRTRIEFSYLTRSPSGPRPAAKQSGKSQS